MGISGNLVTHYHLCWGAYKHSLRNKNIKVISVKDTTNEKNKKLKIHKYLPEEKNILCSVYVLRNTENGRCTKIFNFNDNLSKSFRKQDNNSIYWDPSF